MKTSDIQNLKRLILSSLEETNVIKFNSVKAKTSDNNVDLHVHNELNNVVMGKYFNQDVSHLEDVISKHGYVKSDIPEHWQHKNDSNTLIQFSANHGWHHDKIVNGKITSINHGKGILSLNKHLTDFHK